MDKILGLSLIVFIVIGIAINIRRYASLFAKNSSKIKVDLEDENKKIVIERELEILERSKIAVEKANAIIQLIMNSYMTVHVLVNKGNSYNDKSQTKGFCRSLSVDTINRIKMLEDYDG